MHRIALLGDYSPDVPAHRAIPIALTRVRDELKSDIAWDWIHTREIKKAAHDLAAFSALWLVPASPYENTDGALDAVRFARETRRPFLGTCGGFQHALIEFARHVAGLADADHAESNPSAATLVVTPLACSLVEQGGNLHFAPGSLIASAYGCETAHERYHCRYGFNAVHRAPLESAGLHFTAFDDAGDIRAAELSRTSHPFFVGTLFQPERAVFYDMTPPLVRAFAAARSSDKISPQVSPRAFSDA